MTGGKVIRQGPEGRRIIWNDPMDGDDNIPRNPDGLYVEAESVSVFVNVLVGVIVIMLVTVIMMIRQCVLRTIVRICVNLYVPVVVTVMSLNVTILT